MVLPFPLVMGILKMQLEGPDEVFLSGFCIPHCQSYTVLKGKFCFAWGQTPSLLNT